MCIIRPVLITRMVGAELRRVAPYAASSVPTRLTRRYCLCTIPVSTSFSITACRLGRCVAVGRFSGKLTLLSYFSLGVVVNGGCNVCDFYFYFSSVKVCYTF